jgi:hypothetical protein
MTGLVEQLQENAANTDAALQVQLDELKAKAAQSRALQSRASSLEYNLEKAEDQLVQADAQFETLKARLAQFHDQSANWWGISSPTSNVTVVSPPDYTILLALEAAIADYDTRVRKILLERIAAAKRELKEFQRQLTS